MSSFKPTIHKDLGFGIKLIGENEVCRPSPFVGLTYYNPALDKWMRIHSIKGNILTDPKAYVQREDWIGSKWKPRELTFSAEDAYTGFYQNRAVLLPGEEKCPLMPIEMCEEVPEKALVCRYIENASKPRWAVFKSISSWRRIDARMGNVMLIRYHCVTSEVLCKNNDGRSVCFKCGQQTVDLPLFTSITKICPECKI